MNKTNTTAALTGQVEDNQIAAWKKSHPQGIYGVAAGGHIAYFKKPTRNEVNCAFSVKNRENAQPLDVVEEMATLTYLGGSEEVLKNDSLFLGASVLIREAMDGVTAKLVNL